MAELRYSINPETDVLIFGRFYDVGVNCIGATIFCWYGIAWRYVRTGEIYGVVEFQFFQRYGGQSTPNYPIWNLEKIVALFITREKQFFSVMRKGSVVVQISRLTASLLKLSCESPRFYEAGESKHTEGLKKWDTYLYRIRGIK